MWKDRFALDYVFSTSITYITFLVPVPFRVRTVAKLNASILMTTGVLRREPWDLLFSQALRDVLRPNSRDMLRDQRYLAAGLRQRSPPLFMVVTTRTHLLAAREDCAREIV